VRLRKLTCCVTCCVWSLHAYGSAGSSTPDLAPEQRLLASVASRTRSRRSYQAGQMGRTVVASTFRTFHPSIIGTPTLGAQPSSHTLHQRCQSCLSRHPMLKCESFWACRTVAVSSTFASLWAIACAAPSECPRVEKVRALSCTTLLPSLLLRRHARQSRSKVELIPVDEHVFGSLCS